MSEHKYNEAYDKGFADGKKLAFSDYCYQCYDELSTSEQVELMVKWGADIPNILDKIKAEIRKGKYAEKKGLSERSLIYANGWDDGLELAIDIIDKYRCDKEEVSK